MASASKSDLFIFGAHGRKPLREQVTPHKVSLLGLIYEYCEMKRSVLYMGLCQPTSAEEKFTETEKRDFMITILKLLQSPDLSLKELLDQVQSILKPALLENFTFRLREFHDEGVLPFMDFFQELSRILNPPGSEPLIVGSSVLGLFLRRMILVFDKLSFSQVTKLYTRFKDYYEEFNVPPPGEDSEAFGGSLIDSITSQSGAGKLTRSGLAKSFDHNLMGDGKGDEGEGGFYSHKQAEYFISRQGFLMQHNENEALSPARLQEKITDMLRSNPDIAEAHFLSYLNNLRVREYCTAVHNLYHYFDRNTNLSGPMDAPSTAANKQNKEEDVSRRYAALNLAALHFRFGHRDDSLAALQEAIRMAQETNDHICLQHALSWLHRLEEPGCARTANLMSRSVTKSGELLLPNITSLGVQALAKHNAFATAKPSSVFDFLLKSDILNCQHSQAHFMCVSYAQKAALWNLYGKRENSSMSSQLVLHLDTSDSGIYHNGESVCLSLCDMARQHADQGHYATSLDILNNAKQRFPSHSQFAHIWTSCEQEILFDRTLLNQNWNITEQAVVNLRGLDEDEANLRGAILNKEKGNIPCALEALHALLEKYKHNNRKYTPDYPCRVLLVLSELYIQTGNTTSAMSHILDCLTHAKDHHLQYLIAIATVHLAFVQGFTSDQQLRSLTIKFLMKLPGQAVKLLDAQMIQVMAHGSLFDQARTLYCYARCQVAASATKQPHERKTAMLMAVNMMNTVIEKFKKIEAFPRVKDATYYQARLYHELGYTAERNKCSYQFKQLDQQYPTVNQVTVNAL